MKLHTLFAALLLLPGLAHADVLVTEKVPAPGIGFGTRCVGRETAGLFSMMPPRRVGRTCGSWSSLPVGRR